MNTSSDVISRYLDGLASVTPYQASEREIEHLERQGLCDFIFQKITSSEFRRSKLDDEMADDVRSKVKAHLDDQSPISFAVPFGAYKHWRAWSYPEPDWAEVFNLNYMLRYVDPIAAVYAPGVAVHYSYGDSVMDVVSNMPPCDTERYVTKLKTLIGFFAARARTNVSIDSVRINNFYTKEEHMAEFRGHYEDNVLNWTRKYSEADRAGKLASALRNLMPKGVEDLTGLTKEEWQRRALTSAMWCDAHDSLSRRRGFNKRSGHIQLGNIKGRRLELHVGSCETSVNQFWVGVGLLEVHGERLLPRIVSQEKLDAIRADAGKTESRSKIERVQVSTGFQVVSPNYGAVDVLEPIS